METIYLLGILAILFKLLLLDDSFDILTWIKHGRQCWGWHKNRQTFEEYLEKQKTVDEKLDECIAKWEK